MVIPLFEILCEQAKEASEQEGFEPSKELEKILYSSSVSRNVLKKKRAKRAIQKPKKRGRAKR